MAYLIFRGVVGAGASLRRSSHRAIDTSAGPTGPRVVSNSSRNAKCCFRELARLRKWDHPFVCGNASAEATRSGVHGAAFRVRLKDTRQLSQNRPPNKKLLTCFASSDSVSRLELGMNELAEKEKPSYNGIFLILLVNIGIYVADHWLRLAGVRTLYLYHDFPRWYQFITSTFCHLSWNHLSSNLFFLYIFGKLVEEEGGSFAVWLSYIITGVGANLVSWLILPRSVVSAGASGAVFGLFAVSVLVKLSFNWRKILEVLILGQFVVERVMEAAHASAQLGGHVYNSSMNINHIAHLSGALVGVALIYVLRCIPSRHPEKN